MVNRKITATMIFTVILGLMAFGFYKIPKVKSQKQELIELKIEVAKLNIKKLKRELDKQ